MKERDFTKMLGVVLIGIILAVGVTFAIVSVPIVAFRIAFIAPVLFAAAAGVLIALAVNQKNKSGYHNGDIMHTDHYKKYQRPEGADKYSRADPCAFSEQHSYNKSKAYNDDPWDL